MSRFEDLPYRPCVGLTVINAAGDVFIGRRSEGPEHIGSGPPARPARIEGVTPGGRCSGRPWAPAGGRLPVARALIPRAEVSPAPLRIALGPRIKKPPQNRASPTQ
jgi:hypothetical protein